jgi:hypothetical protein
MSKPLAAALFLAATLPLGAAHAQSPANMLAELGMIGRWAADCSRPAGGNNPHVVFERVDSASGAQYRVIFGPTQSTTRSVDNVRALGEGKIAMRFTTLTGDTTGLAFDITMRKEATRWQVFASKGSDGKVYIENGVVIATGAANPWQNKCSE